MSDDKEQTDSQENADNIQSCCGGGSCCSSGSDGQGRGWKMVVFILIVIAAGAVLARSFLRKSNSDACQSQQTFPSIQAEFKNEIPSVTDNTAKQETSVKDAPVLWKAELDSLASLNKVAADTDAVFVFLAAEDRQDNRNIISQIEAAAKTINADGIRVSAFKLNKTAPDYAQLAKQFPVPSVLAMVKGRGMSAVSGQISETKLVQAYVTASRPASGCCPSGTGSSDCPPLGPRR